MESIVDKGGAKAIGLISASMSQISTILSFCRIKPAVNSVEVSTELSQSVCWKARLCCKLAACISGSPSSSTSKSTIMGFQLAFMIQL